MYNYTKPRVPIAAMYVGPGPTYGMRGLFGYDNHDTQSIFRRAPRYTFGIKHKDWTEYVGPGPCYFPDPKQHPRALRSVERWTMMGRGNEGTMFVTPGPGAYMSEVADMKNCWQRAPKYTFGLRNTILHADVTPAPNQYVLPPVMPYTVEGSKRQAPAFTMVSKRKNFIEGYQLSPGPANYNNVPLDLYLPHSPKYTMTSKACPPSMVTTIPGPGAHFTEKVTSHLRQAPKFTFGLKHSPYTAPLIVEVAD